MHGYEKWPLLLPQQHTENTLQKRTLFTAFSSLSHSIFHGHTVNINGLGSLCGGSMVFFFLLSPYFSCKKYTGIRKPPVPFGINGRSISGSVVPSATGSEKKSMRLQVGPDPSDMRTATFSVSTPEQKTFEREPLTASVAKRKS